MDQKGKRNSLRRGVEQEISEGLPKKKMAHSGKRKGEQRLERREKSG
jgi:hypothetical protein